MALHSGGRPGETNHWGDRAAGAACSARVQILYAQRSRGFAPQLFARRYNYPSAEPRQAAGQSPHEAPMDPTPTRTPTLLDPQLLWATFALIAILLLGAIIFAWLDRWRKRNKREP